MNSLHSDIVRLILARVPRETLCKSAYRVCKRWLDLLDERFWKAYLKVESNPTKYSWTMYAGFVRFVEGAFYPELDGKHILGKIARSGRGVYVGMSHSKLMRGYGNYFRISGYGQLHAFNGCKYEGYFGTVWDKGYPRDETFLRGTITLPNGDCLEIFTPITRQNTVRWARLEHTCEIENADGHSVTHRHIEYGCYNLCTYPGRNSCYTYSLSPFLRHGKRFYSDGRTLQVKNGYHNNYQKAIYTWPDGSVYRGTFVTEDGLARSARGKMRWPPIQGSTTETTSWEGYWWNDRRLGDETCCGKRWDGFFLLSEADQYRKVQEVMSRAKTYKNR